MSTGREILHNVKAQQVLAPAAYKTAQGPAAIDMNGYEALTLVLSVGVITDGTFGVTLQDSDDGTSYSAVAAENILSPGESDNAENPDYPSIGGSLPTGLATGAGNGGSAVYPIAYIGQKRYVQAAVTVSGTPATGAQLSMIALLGNPRHAPVY